MPPEGRQITQLHETSSGKATGRGDNCGDLENELSASVFRLFRILYIHAYTYTRAHTQLGSQL